VDNVEYYRIVAWNGCPWCDKAYDLLTASGVEVHITYHERGSQALQEAKNQNNWQTVPMVTHVSVQGDDITETFVGGYDNLCHFLEKQGD